MSYEDTMEFWVKGVFIGLVGIFGLICNIIAIYILSKSILKSDNKSFTERLLLGKFQVLFTDLEYIFFMLFGCLCFHIFVIYWACLGLAYLCVACLSTACLGLACLHGRGLATFCGLPACLP